MNETVNDTVSQGAQKIQEGIAMGKFQGVIRPHTPTGARTVWHDLFGSSEGVVKPWSRRPSPAMW